MGVKAGYDAAKERCREEIELLKFLLPANSGNIEKDLIFLALHRGYKQQKAARALSRETIALVKEAAAQKRGKDYEEKVWRDLCGAKELNEWPLRPYGDSLHTLTGNMSRVADYIKILKAEMAAYPQIKETSFGQKIKNMLNKGGEWLEDITKGIGALITEWRGIKKEEDKKIEQRAKQPAGNGFTPTPSAVRYWKVKDSTVNVVGVSSQLDTLFEKFVQYLGVEVGEGYFIITDGQRPVDNQLYHVLGDYLKKGSSKSLYKNFITNAGNEDIFKKIDTNKYPYLTNGSANSLSNPAVQELKKKLTLNYSGEDKLLQAMQNTNMPFPHVRSNAADLSINITNDPHQYSLRMNEENFKKRVKEIAVIGVHSAGYGATHIHLSFR